MEGKRKAHFFNDGAQIWLAKRAQEPRGMAIARKWVHPGWRYRRATIGETTTRLEEPILTVLRVVPAAAVAANVLYLFPDVTVDGKGDVVVVVRMLAVPFLVAERHDFDQAERLFLRFLHRHGRVFSAPRGNPGAVHDGGRGIHRRVIDRLEHRGSVAEKEREREKKRERSGNAAVWV